jgi:hypothetical protein
MKQDSKKSGDDPSVVYSQYTAFALELQSMCEGKPAQDV